MNYIFHLGRIPALSIAEIQSILKKSNIGYKAMESDSKFLILDINEKINHEELLVQMGGIIKISESIDRFQNIDEAFEKIEKLIREFSSDKPTKKTIGYSIYFTENSGKNKAFNTSKEIKKRFFDMKKSLSGKVSTRIVFPDTSLELTSASIYKNNLIKKGAEFNFVVGKNSVLLSKTVAVQDIDSYSERDYGRPRRNSKAGMIPPKLAQIMINLAEVGKGQVIFDPFCGTGTVLQEALLNDYRVIGSDADSKQIENCQKNLEWISKKYIIEFPEYKIFQSNFSDVAKKINKNSIDAIVTESVLGPIYKKPPKEAEISQNFNRLEKMYLSFFQIAKLILRKKSRIVITIPAYKTSANSYTSAPFIDKLEKIGYSILYPIKKDLTYKNIGITSRSSIIYDRPDQIVAREVMIFENK